MTSPAAPLALAMGLLILSIVLAIALIPALDHLMRQEVARQLTRRVANDNEGAAVREQERRIG